MSSPTSPIPVPDPIPLVSRITDFVCRHTGTTESSALAADDQTFDRLAWQVFELQYQQVEPFRRLCDHRAVHPTDERKDWRRVPAVPVIAFRTQALHIAEPEEIFRSSGTTGGEAERSVHRHPFPRLYRQVIDRTFAEYVLPEDTRSEPRPFLSLIPERRTVPDSSLSFMTEHVMARHAAEGDSTYAMDATGLRFDLARQWLQAHGRRPVTVLTTAFALAFLLDALQEADLRFSLPTGSTLFETGGFKGRSQELSRQELLQRVERHLGLKANAVVREYGMTELTGHFYTRVLSGGDDDVFAVPHFLRVRLLDPQTFAEVPTGQPGLISVFDLANVGSCAHLVTQDLGIAVQDGFRLLGRADQSQLRGCSLTAEELNRPGML